VIPGRCSVQAKLRAVSVTPASLARTDHQSGTPKGPKVHAHANPPTAQLTPSVATWIVHRCQRGRHLADSDGCLSRHLSFLAAFSGFLLSPPWTRSAPPTGRSLCRSCRSGEPESAYRRNVSWSATPSYRSPAVGGLGYDEAGSRASQLVRMVWLAFSASTVVGGVRQPTVRRRGDRRPVGATASTDAAALKLLFGPAKTAGG
jgi:hypothetical protein